MTRRKISLSQVLLILFAIAVFEVTAHAQFTVTVTGETPGGFPIDDGSQIEAPGNPFTVIATVSPLSGVTKVVFYRNDVPYVTDTSWPFELEQSQLGQRQLGQDNYTYRARAYHSSGTWVDSSDYKLTYYSPRVIKMGDPKAEVETHGPGRFQDHTEDIRAAVNWLHDNGGGTLFFPCTAPPDDPLIAIYNIRETIIIPEDVTLQGESSEEFGKCRIYWNDVDAFPPNLPGCHTTPGNLRRAPMFKIVGGYIQSTVSGPPYDVEDYRAELFRPRRLGSNCNRRDTPQSKWLRRTKRGTGDITDIIFDNVTITHFTHGITALSDNGSEDENEISGDEDSGLQTGREQRGAFHRCQIRLQLGYSKYESWRDFAGPGRRRDPECRKAVGNGWRKHQDQVSPA